MNTANNDKETLLNFPEPFPIKIFGLDDADFNQAVKVIIEEHVEEQHILTWNSNASSKGKYLALSVTIMAQNQAQLDNIYQALTDSEWVKMAL